MMEVKSTTKRSLSEDGSKAVISIDGVTRNKSPKSFKTQVNSGRRVWDLGIQSSSIQILFDNIVTDWYLWPSWIVVLLDEAVVDVLHSP